MSRNVWVALPTLFGQAANGSRPSFVTPQARPMDPDDLPIAAEQTPEEQALMSQLFPSLDAGADPAAG